jgi:hypothetical protein
MLCFSPIEAVLSSPFQKPESPTHLEDAVSAESVNGIANRYRKSLLTRTVNGTTPPHRRQADLPGRTRSAEISLTLPHEYGKDHQAGAQRLREPIMVEFPRPVDFQ